MVLIKACGSSGGGGGSSGGGGGGGININRSNKQGKT